MGLCCELSTGCCGCSIRSTTCIALCHYMIYGVFVVSFVFSNECYPPFSYPDYFFGGSGAALLVISFLAAWTVDLKSFQFLRAVMGLLVILAVLFTVATCYYYTIVRWHDVMVTILSKAIRHKHFTEFPDYLWFTLVVIACINCPFFLIYLVYIASFMLNKWKSHLFTSPYRNNEMISSLPPTLTVPADNYSTRGYRPYPVQPQQ